eukprot:6487512-Amphidinium_carterae.1
MPIWTPFRTTGGPCSSIHGCETPVEHLHHSCVGVLGRQVVGEHHQGESVGPPPTPLPRKRPAINFQGLRSVPVEGNTVLPK